MIVLAGAGYVVIGTAAALFAGTASSPAAVKTWRAAAWLLSVVLFVFHFTAERRRSVPRLRVAVDVALAVASGAAGLAVLGPLRAHWADPARFRLALLSIVAWPLLAGVPTFVVALVGGFLLDRVRRLTHSR